MDRYDDRIKLDIFKGQTTYQCDFKRFPLEPKTSKITEYIEEKPVKQHNITYQDNETFTKWRENSRVPFNLLWRPKEIIHTDPYAPFEFPVIPETTADKEEAIRTRPRVYMSPAVSMDDVPDPEMRKLLCSHMYTSEWKKAMLETAIQAPKRHIPNTTIEIQADPVGLKVDLLPPLPKHFRHKGIKWENEQTKGCVDPTRTFWEHKNPPVKCGACNDPVEGLVSNETKDKIKDLIHREKLRLPHDVPIPGYAGYKPRLSFGVPLEKQKLPVTHPLLSVSQTITKRFEEDQ